MNFDFSEILMEVVRQKASDLHLTSGSPSMLRKRGQLAHVDNPEAWVRTVALNRLRGGWRHASVVRRYQARVPGPQAPVEAGPEHVAIVTALAELDPDQARRLTAEYLDQVAASNRFDGLDWSADVTGTTVTVQLTSTVELPFQPPGFPGTADIGTEASAVVPIR